MAGAGNIFSAANNTNGVGSQGTSNYGANNYQAIAQPSQNIGGGFNTIYNPSELQALQQQLNPNAGNALIGNIFDRTINNINARGQQTGSQNVNAGGGFGAMGGAAPIGQTEAQRQQVIQGMQNLAAQTQQQQQQQVQQYQPVQRVGTQATAAQQYFQNIPRNPIRRGGLGSLLSRR
jgi:hypothetical protein